MSLPSTEWAQEEFGGAVLGDARRSARLVCMASRACVRPSGKLTETFAVESEREAGYRFVENAAIDATAVAKASHDATFARAIDEQVLLAPTDSVSFTLPVGIDSEHGSVGNKWASTLGSFALSAIALTEEGVPVGPIGQVFWTRARHTRRSRKSSYGEGRVRTKDRRPIAEKETRHWGTAIQQAMQSADDRGYRGTLWFQCDAGADFYELLCVAPTLKCWLTIRAAHEARLLWDSEQTLIDYVGRTGALGTYELPVRAGPNRSARTATMQVHASAVVLRIRDRISGSAIGSPMFAVYAREVSEVPSGQDPIDWLLLTTYSATTFAQATRVIRAYATRWRIEEVHKTWKSVTKVEESALESVNAFALWATILFAIAVRIERLKHLARQSPNLPADVELTPLELKAIHLLKEKPGDPSKLPMPTIAVALMWIAEIGGYTRPSSAGGPPGSITIGRGLKRVTELVPTLALISR